MGSLERGEYYNISFPDSHLVGGGGGGQFAGNSSVAEWQVCPSSRLVSWKRGWRRASTLRTVTFSFFIILQCWNLCVCVCVCVSHTLIGRDAVVVSFFVPFPCASSTLNNSF